ncbi:hypothetical protein RIF29_27967 [Crotalaria pallida]|uniref:F-box domain-containing protein n=1 Tax=Crotalaria pallida TaxID=3830 RepID=A0AAN9EQR8_CROPI
MVFVAKGNEILGKKKKKTLPNDVVHEILLRLPIKSLMRFKCVDRSWNVLLKTPSFVTMHTLMQREERLMIFNHQVRNPRCHQTMKRCIDIKLVSSNESHQVQHLKCPSSFQNNPSSLELSGFHPLGLHKGVFCLYGSYTKTKWHEAGDPVHHFNVVINCNKKYCYVYRYVESIASLTSSSNSKVGY